MSAVNSSKTPLQKTYLQKAKVRAFVRPYLQAAVLRLVTVPRPPVLEAFADAGFLDNVCPELHSTAASSSSSSSSSSTSTSTHSAKQQPRRSTHFVPPPLPPAPILPKSVTDNVRDLAALERRLCGLLSPFGAVAAGGGPSSHVSLRASRYHRELLKTVSENNDVSSRHSQCVRAVEFLRRTSVLHAGGEMAFRSFLQANFEAPTDVSGDAADKVELLVKAANLLSLHALVYVSPSARSLNSSAESDIPPNLCSAVCSSFDQALFFALITDWFAALANQRYLLSTLDIDPLSFRLDQVDRDVLGLLPLVAQEEENRQAAAGGGGSGITPTPTRRGGGSSANNAAASGLFTGVLTEAAQTWVKVSDDAAAKFDIMVQGVKENFGEELYTRLVMPKDIVGGGQFRTIAKGAEEDWLLDGSLRGTVFEDLLDGVFE